MPTQKNLALSQFIRYAYIHELPLLPFFVVVAHLPAKHSQYAFLFIRICLECTPAMDIVLEGIFPVYKLPSETDTFI